MQPWLRWITSTPTTCASGTPRATRTTSGHRTRGARQVIQACSTVHHLRATDPSDTGASANQHLSRGWFRNTIWFPALHQAALTHPARIHDLRHTNASWMLAGGADLETIRERLGHRSLRATERYLHTLPNTALTALHRTRTCPPHTPAPGQLTVTNPPSRQPQN